MGFFSKLFGNKKEKLELTEEEIIEAGACPNCWGTQEYEGEIRKLVEDITKSNVSHDKTKKKAFVTQFVETNITGIRLKKDGDQLACPKCKAKYQRK